nr:MAG TPA: hypothetical protein [Caudoviricetes sp.]
MVSYYRSDLYFIFFKSNSMFFSSFIKVIE